MAHRNRVDPYGRIVAIEQRGRWIGNRGCIHRDFEIARPWQTKRWIVCALHYKDFRAPKWVPNRWTPLYFFDEALAFAAGHRPCALCRRESFNAYCAAAGMSRADPIDALLHEQRVAGREKKAHALAWRELPDGAYVEADGVPHLVRGTSLHPWSPQGYGSPCERPRTGTARVLTPPLSLRVLREGYPIDVAPL